MRAMILAAGRGERMGALTATTPKPLLKVGKRFLIEYAIDSVRKAGITDVVINVSYLAEQIQTALGDGSEYGVKIHYSVEPERLEVGGGIHQALPLLGDDPFIVISSDMITDFPLQKLVDKHTDYAHLILVKNPVYHVFGDFGLNANNIVDFFAKPRFTFASIGLYNPQLFAEHPPGFYPWIQLMQPKIQSKLVTGELYQGAWYNVGTPDELEQATLSPICSA